MWCAKKPGRRGIRSTVNAGSGSRPRPSRPTTSSTGAIGWLAIDGMWKNISWSTSTAGITMSICFRKTGPPSKIGIPRCASPICSMFSSWVASSFGRRLPDAACKGRSAGSMSLGPEIGSTLSGWLACEMPDPNAASSGSRSRSVRNIGRIVEVHDVHRFTASSTQWPHGNPLTNGRARNPIPDDEAREVE